MQPIGPVWLRFAVGFLLAGFPYTGRQMIYTAFNILILAAFICLGIELKENMKGRG